MSSSFKKIFKTRRSPKESDMSRIDIGDKKQEKFEFSIPKDVYVLMKEIKENFNSVYRKVKLRSGINLLKTSKDTYMYDMQQLCECYGGLFNFFGVNSLQEDKTRDKFSEMQKNYYNYPEYNVNNVDKSKLISTTFANKTFKKISDYCECFNKNYITKQISGGSVYKQNLNLLVNVLIKALNISLVYADKNIMELKKSIVENGNATYYGEMNPYVVSIKNCKAVVTNLKDKLSVATSKFELSFLKKHNSKDLPKILKKINEIQGALSVADDRLEEFYLAVVDSITRKYKQHETNGYKLQNLLLSKRNYESTLEAFLCNMKVGISSPGIMYDYITNLENASKNLGKIVVNKKMAKEPIIKYHQLLEIQSKMTKFKSELEGQSANIEEVVIDALSAAAATRYKISPKRKIEKIFKVLQNIASLLTQTSITVNTVMQQID